MITAVGEIDVDLTEEETVAAVNAWFTVLQLEGLAQQINSEQAESETFRLHIARGRVEGIWQALLASRGINHLTFQVLWNGQPPFGVYLKRVVAPEDPPT